MTRVASSVKETQRGDPSWGDTYLHVFAEEMDDSARIGDMIG